MTFASFFLQVLPASPAMAARGADKEREIEATTELRHMRMSQWTQINKSCTELAGFQGKSLVLTRLITVDALINTLDRQASFCMLVQERISELVETAAEDPKADQEYGAEMYGIIEVLKQDVLDLKAAVELFQDAEHVKRSLDKHNTDDIAIAWRDWHAEQSCILYRDVHSLLGKSDAPTASLMPPIAEWSTSGLRIRTPWCQSPCCWPRRRSRPYHLLLLHHV